MSLNDDAREAGDKLAEISYSRVSDLLGRLVDRIETLEAEVKTLKARHQSILTELYGQDFEILGWHLNGDTEPLDSWFEENNWVENL